MSELDALYQAVIVDHDRSPRNHGPLAGATHEATIDNPLCGDIVTLQLIVADGRITAAGFEGRGCSLSRAAASILTTLLPGRTVAEAGALAAELTAFVAPDATTTIAGELAAFAGVRRFRSRRACVLLAPRALVAATR